MPPAEKQPSLSVIVPTYRRAQSLGRLVESLIPQIAGHSGRELIVVNDASPDAAYDQIIARHRNELVYRVATRNGGPSVARNLGAREATGDFLVFIDDDCVAPPDWLDTLAAILAEHPDYDAIGGSTKPLPFLAPAFLERLFTEGGCHPNPIYYDGYLIVMVSACLAVRRTVFEKLNGFDERLVLAAEDRNLTTRLRLAQAVSVIDPHWFVFHDMAATPRQHFRRFLNYGRGVHRAIAVEAEPLDLTYWPPDRRGLFYWFGRAQARYRAATRDVRTPPGWLRAAVLAFVTVTNLTMDAGYAFAERLRSGQD